MIKFLKAMSLGDWAFVAAVLTIITQAVLLNIMGARLDTKNAEIAKLKATAEFAGQLITIQNNAVGELHRQREEDRKAYLAGIATANKLAASKEAHATTILQLPSPVDPAEQCVAARELLSKELTQ
jgi:hypothetical protein